jgi:hypothetical protein
VRFLTIRKADAETEAGAPPSQAVVTAMVQYNGEMVDAGVMRSGDGLQPSAKGARVRFCAGRLTITDGPFAEARELVAGFTIIQVKSKAEALDRVCRWPVDDFGDEFTAELRQQEERLRAGAAAN